MAEKEKEILKKVAEFPAPLRDKFLTMAQGAAMAMDAMTPTNDTAEAKEKGG
jgi:hypothetical protein